MEHGRHAMCPSAREYPLEGDVVSRNRARDRAARSDRYVRRRPSGPLVDYARTVGPLPPSTVGCADLRRGTSLGDDLRLHDEGCPFPDDAESRVMRIHRARRNSDRERREQVRARRLEEAARRSLGRGTAPDRARSARRNPAAARLARVGGPRRRGRSTDGERRCSREVLVRSRPASARPSRICRSSRAAFTRRSSPTPVLDRRSRHSPCARRSPWSWT